MKSPELLVLGIDAFSYDFFTQHKIDSEFYQWFDEEEHNLSLMKPTGEREEPHTGVQWSSMYTGVGPDEHGITRMGWKQEALDYANIQKRTIFSRLDSLGYTQTVYSMPVTYPCPQLASGACVSGFPSPVHGRDTYHWGPKRGDYPDVFEEMFSRPRNLIQVKSELPRRDITSLKAWGSQLNEEQYDRVCNELVEIEVRKRNYALELQKESPSDVVWFGSHAIDKAGHIEGLRPGGQMTEMAYNTIGSVANDLIRRMEPENWVLVSDHGFEMNNHFHDRRGVLMSNRDADDEVQTSDVASGLCELLGEGTSWIGRSRSRLRDGGDKEAIKKRLRDMGYI